MIARTSWSAKADRRSGNETSESAGDQSGLRLDDLLDARFDEAGQLAQVGRGNRQRIAERLDPRPPAMSADELERAVQKLAQGLEAIERQNHQPQSEPKAAQQNATNAPTSAAEPRSRDFVTSSLDRLEARLEALSKRLQERRQPQPPLPVLSDAAAGDVSNADESAPSLAVEADQPVPQTAPVADPAPAESPVAFVGSEPSGTESGERAEVGAADATSRPLESGEEERPRPARDPAGAAQAVHGDERHDAALVDVRQQFAGLQSRIEDMQRSLDGNQIEPIRREMLELLHQLQEVGRDGRAVAGAVGDVRAKLDDMETKLNAARNMTGNRISELQDRLSGLGERLGGIEAEVPGFDAVRENQTAILERFDRMEGLVHRLASPEEVVGRIESMRRQLQAIASQRELARMEGAIVGLAERLDALPEQVGDRTLLARIEGQLESFAAEFAETRRHSTLGAAELESRFAELSAGLKGLGEADHTTDLSGVEGRLSEVVSRLDDDRQVSGEALQRLESRLSALAVAIEAQENDAAEQALAALTHKMDRVAEAIEAQDAGGTRRDLEGLSRKLDQLSHALSEQAEHLSRPQLAPLEDRLDAMQAQMEDLAVRATDSSAQFGPFAETLQQIADRVSGIGAAFPESELVHRLAAIEERLAGVSARGLDPRALHTQLESIVSRLEVLKGRSIDPARLTDLFERVDSAMRAGRMEEILERIEGKLDGTNVPAEQFQLIERRIAESASTAFPEDRLQRLEQQIAAVLQDRAGLEHLQRIEQKLEAGVQVDFADDRLERLERKIDEIGHLSGAASELVTPDDVADLRADIVALRRELRSLPALGGDTEANIPGLLQGISEQLNRLPKDPPATAAELETQVDRLARLLDDPSQSRLALAHVEASLRGLEERLDEARGSGPGDSSGHFGGDEQLEIDTVADIARALSDDVSLLRGATEASERRTKDALEAVHGTLEAVVKRMAFLEREEGAPAKPAEPTESRRQQEAAPSAPAVQETERLIEQAAEHSAVEHRREAAPGGLFSRFTSSQLLKRATGGRADSFSPDLDERDEDGDEPLEPGTNAPLSSALAGAPSSDTTLMSGGRSRDKNAAPSANAPEGDLVEARRVGAEPAGDDFLAAARRAAQAAAAEAVEAEQQAESSRRRGLPRFLGGGRARRRALLASVLAVALAFAAYQLIQSNLLPNPTAVADPTDPEIATASVERAALPPPPDVAAAPTVEAVPQSAVVEAAPTVPEPPAAAAATTEEIVPVPAPAAPPPVPAGPATAVEEGPDRALEAGVLTGEASTEAPAGTGRRVRTAALPAPGSAPGPDAAVAPPAEPTPAPVEAAPAPQAPAPAAAAPSQAPAPVPDSVPEEIGSERLRTAALSGDPVASFEVAARLAEGRGVSQDLPAAVAWYRSAAETGLAPAQYRLGSIFEKGHGVPKDLAAAMDWYTRASDAGNVKAMHNLAVLYAEGAAGTPDLERAARLFRQAAEHGVRDSQFNLAILHARGLGVPQDMLEAYKWFAVAASSGDAEAVKRRDIIAAALSPEDLEKAQATAAAFQPVPLMAEANDVMMPEGGWGDDTSSVELQSPEQMIALVQQLLAEQGYDPGPPDGVLGTQTTEAITSFQAKAGLPATGQIDAGLVAALKNESS